MGKRVDLVLLTPTRVEWVRDRASLVRKLDRLENRGVEYFVFTRTDLLEIMSQRKDKVILLDCGHGKENRCGFCKLCITCSGDLEDPGNGEWAYCPNCKGV